VNVTVDPRHVSRLAVTLTLACLAFTSPVGAQDACRFLCAPALEVEPTITISNLFKRHVIRTLPDGEPRRVRRQTAFELILALDIPTEVPRLGFTVEAIWPPVDNPVELEFETNLIWLPAARTGGWVSSHFDIVDKYSPGQRPRDGGDYTHKLNFELDTAVSAFKWVRSSPWLRRVEIEGSLDYVATGLPKAGDELNGERFLSDASRWSFSLVFVVPVAPRP
jgi:hypothetical protein